MFNVEGGAGNTFYTGNTPFPQTANISFGRWAKLWEGDLLFCYCGLEIQGGVWKVLHKNPWKQPKHVLNFKSIVPTDLKLQKNRLRSYAWSFTQQGIRLSLTYVRSLRSVWFVSPQSELWPKQACADVNFLLDKLKPQLWDETLLGAPEVDTTFCQRTYHPISYRVWQLNCEQLCGLLMPLTPSKALPRGYAIQPHTPSHGIYHSVVQKFSYATPLTTSLWSHSWDNHFTQPRPG